ncbi:hypothetical protein KILIM_116_00070, partial [Kineosphaera limosa NBRC 100340]
MRADRRAAPRLRAWWGAAQRRLADDAGMSTVLSLGIILVTIALMFAGLLIAGAVLATHRARGAADLAALAAATR